MTGWRASFLSFVCFSKAFSSSTYSRARATLIARQSIHCPAHAVQECRRSNACQKLGPYSTREWYLTSYRHRMVTHKRISCILCVVSYLSLQHIIKGNPHNSNAVRIRHAWSWCHPCKEHKKHSYEGTISVAERGCSCFLNHPSKKIHSLPSVLLNHPAENT